MPLKPYYQNRDISLYLNDAASWLEQLEAESVDLIITDPAYSGMNRHLMLGSGRIVGQYDARGSERWFDEFEDTQSNYRRLLAACQRVLRNNSHLFIMFDAFSLLSLGPLLREYFEVKNLITWDKAHMGMGHYFRRQTEFILFASKGRKPLARRDIADIWRFRRIHRARYPTQKPVELFEAMIASSRAVDESVFTVCDPFTGSGSSAIASIRQNCRFIGADIAERALDLSIERIEHLHTYGTDPLQPTTAVAVNQKRFWEHQTDASS